MVDPLLRHVQQEPSGASAVAAVGQGGAVVSYGHLHSAKGELPAAADVQAVSVYPLLFTVGRDLVIGDDGGARLAADGNGVAQVISVAVRYQDVVRLGDVVRTDVRLRIAAEEGVKPDGVSTSGEAETGMAVIGQSDSYCIPPVVAGARLSLF